VAHPLGHGLATVLVVVLMPQIVLKQKLQLTAVPALAPLLNLPNHQAHLLVLQVLTQTHLQILQPMDCKHGIGLAER
jgi:hypothetical protein